MLPAANITAIFLSLVSNGFFNYTNIHPDTWPGFFTNYTATFMLDRIHNKTGIHKQDIIKFVDQTVPCMVKVTTKINTTNATVLSENILFYW